MKNRVLFFLLAALIVALVLPVAALGQVTEVVTLGANLDQAQRNEMLDLFEVEADEVLVLEVTNAEEREYLQGLVPDAQIGTRAISSVYVVLEDDGSGIDVRTHNITFVTEQTYANALVTAGVRDAEVFAAAPFPVSGTAALTGVFKAFEEATGEDISEEAKQTATAELVETAEVGEEVGDKDAVADLMTRAKEEVIERGLDDPAAVREVVINIANELNIELTDEQIDDLVNILIRIESLDLDVDRLRDQIEGFGESIGISGEEAEGLWESIKDFFRSLWDAIFG
ncbi:MAG: DUF1002 domain-containing protein [Thermoleophilia bacterium]